MKIKCNVCGKRFVPLKERTYQVQETLEGLAALAGKNKIYDAIDCPRCGCQKLLGIRIPALRDEKASEEKEAVEENFAFDVEL